MIFVRKYRYWAGAILLLAAVNLFAFLNETKIHEWDEARYGVSAWEMVRSGDYLRTTFGGEPEYWNLKPPLGYWLIAGSYKVFGPTKFALRFPSALAALLCVAAVMYFAKRHFNRRVALLGGLALATSMPFIAKHCGRSGDVDAPLTLLLTLAVLLLFEKERVLAIGVLLGLGFLTKSFAILPIALVVAVVARKSGWRLVGAAAIFLAIVGAWAVARGDTQFLKRMIVEDLFERGSLESEGRAWSPFYYAMILVKNPAFWIALFALWRRPDRKVGLLLAWIAVPLVAFSAAKTQYAWYVTPVLPAICILAAVSVVRLPRYRIAMALVLVAACGLGEGQIVRNIAKDIREVGSEPYVLKLAKTQPQLHGIVPWNNSERFVLEVQGGMKLGPIHDPKAIPPGTRILVKNELLGRVPPGELVTMDRVYRVIQY